MICPSCQAENDPTAEMCFTCGRGLTGLTRGSVIAARYEILELLGKGGMGMVYKAKDRVLDEAVAIKVLRAGFADLPELQQRFFQEIKLARKVSHRNVCRIHEYGEDGGMSYISMAFVDGVDLRRVLKEKGPLPQDEAYDVVLQVADGLQAIHDEGVIHRDLKAPNIMRDAKGVVKLMDFGIAKEWSAATVQGLTTTGMIVGTPEYVSPEQAQGRKIDFRSDVYALGVVTYELFTGDVPFRGDSAFTTIQKHIREPPPLDGPRAARIPRPLVPVLRKALAKEPALRYATVREMGEAVREARGATARQEVAATEQALAETAALSRTAPGAPLAAPAVRTRVLRPPRPMPASAPEEPRPGGSRPWVIVAVVLVAALIVMARRHRAPVEPTPAPPPAETMVMAPATPRPDVPPQTMAPPVTPVFTPEPPAAPTSTEPSPAGPVQNPAEDLQRACELGSAQACFSLAEGYRMGNRGLPQDPSRAADLYERACDRDFAQACTHLAVMYFAGNGVRQDLARAAALVKRGCEGHDPRACQMLKLAGRAR